jgi:dolichol-phosphate mannosyltransferase
MQSLTTAVLQGNSRYRGEVIFVDDGSGDASFEELRRIQIEAPATVTVIKLTRNFGQQGALLAGYHHAKGKCVISMAADGQEPPEMINEMLAAFFEENYEVVICARSGRDESAYRIITSRLFYYLMRILTFSDMPKGGFDFWLLSRRASEAMVRNSDVQPFFQSAILWTGFRTKILSYRRRERLAGASRLSFRKKYGAFLAGMLSHSFAPIRLMSLAGCTLAFLGFIWAACIVLDYLQGGHAVKGWPPLMIMILVIGGFQMVMLGVIGEYLWRTLEQVRRRDMYLIDAVYERDSQDS